MITQRAMNFAKVLQDGGVSSADVETSNDLLTQVPVLTEVLDNPLVKREEKKNVIQALFPEHMWKFMRLLCEHNAVSIWEAIFQAYKELELEEKNQIKATLTYAVKLDGQEIEQIKNMICKKYNKTGVELVLKEDPSLIGGIVLKVKDTEYDKSIKGTMRELQKTLVRR